MLAIDLTGTLLARRVRDRDSHTFSIIHEGMQQAGFAGTGRSREDEKYALVHVMFFTGSRGIASLCSCSSITVHPHFNDRNCIISLVIWMTIRLSPALKKRTPQMRGSVWSVSPGFNPDHRYDLD
jgi:hypothetical protein